MIYVLLLPVIPRNTDLRDEHFIQNIFTFNPKAYAAIAYDKLIQMSYFETLDTKI